MREINQREYEAQNKAMDDIYHLSPVMRATLKWFASGGGFGCPGTHATFAALKKRGLLRQLHAGQYEINDIGRRAAT